MLLQVKSFDMLVHEEVRRANSVSSGVSRWAFFSMMTNRILVAFTLLGSVVSSSTQQPLEPLIKFRTFQEHDTLWQDLREVISFLHVRADASKNYGWSPLCWRLCAQLPSLHSEPVQVHVERIDCLLSIDVGRIARQQQIQKVCLIVNGVT